MNIYYVFMEGRPLPNNKESEEFTGAYINCWVKSKSKAAARKNAIEYVYDEGWQVDDIEEISIVDRESYLDTPESLECVDQAISCGIGAAFYTW